MTHEGKLFFFVSNFNVCVTDVKNDPELTVHYRKIWIIIIIDNNYNILYAKPKQSLVVLSHDPVYEVLVFYFFNV
jgi:hypothetical protein